MNIARQQHASETARPSALERRLCNVMADCIGAMIRFGIPRERAKEIFMDELIWRILPAGERPVMAPSPDVIEEQIRLSPF